MTCGTLHLSVVRKTSNGALCHYFLPRLIEPTRKACGWPIAVIAMFSSLLKIRPCYRRIPTFVNSPSKRIETTISVTPAIAESRALISRRLQSSSSKQPSNSTSSSEAADSTNQKSTSETDVSEPETSSAQYPRHKKGLLYRMAPPKGGTDPPDAKFLAVASVVVLAGGYAWIIEPPEPYVEENEKSSSASN